MVSRWLSFANLHTAPFRQDTNHLPNGGGAIFLFMVAGGPALKGVSLAALARKDFGFDFNPNWCFSVIVAESYSHFHINCRRSNTSVYQQSLPSVLMVS